jgi:hypothetical protein
LFTIRACFIFSAQLKRKATKEVKNEDSIKVKDKEEKEDKDKDKDKNKEREKDKKPTKAITTKPSKPKAPPTKITTTTTTTTESTAGENSSKESVPVKNTEPELEVEA